MVNEQQLIQFNCQRHRMRNIISVCNKSDCDNNAGCEQCFIRERQCDEHRNKVCSVEEFVTISSDHFQALGTIRASNEIEMPEEFENFMVREEEEIKNVMNQVNDKKTRINEAVSEIINQFTEYCNEFREILFYQLDSQVKLFESNYKTYKNFVENFYNKPNVHLSPTRSEMIQHLNVLNPSSNEFANAVREIKRAIRLTRVTATEEQKIIAMENMIQQKAEQLKLQLDCLAKLHFEDECKSIGSVINEHYSTTRAFLETNFSLKEKIEKIDFELVPQVDSLILKCGKHKILLAQFLFESSKINKLDLIYRGSRDGFTADAFHEKCDNKENTLVVIQSRKNQIFGGFVDIPWESSFWGKYKNSDRAFIFSMTNQQKYEIQSNCNSTAIYCWRDYLAAFGHGHDIVLYDNCHIVDDNYCNFGISYGNQCQCTDDNTVGSFNFVVKEVEVFTFLQTSLQHRQ